MKVQSIVKAVLDAYEGMQNIGSVPTDRERALKVAQVLRVLDMEVNVLTAMRKDQINKYGGVKLVTMQDGRAAYVPFPEGWGKKNSDELIAEQAEMNDEFNLMLLDFNNSDVTIVAPDFAMVDLPDGITGNDVRKCSWLIIDFPEVEDEPAQES